MHFFSKKLAVSGQAEITILPDLYHSEVLFNPVVQYTDPEIDEYDESRPGSDVSEIFQIREYRYGDAMNRIHWKLSAKEDELMIKDYSYPLGFGVLLYMDYFMAAGEKDTLAKLDGMLEISLSLSFSMLMVGCPHYILWSTAEGQLKRYGIRTEGDLHGAIEAALRMRTYPGKVDWEDLYLKQYASDFSGKRLVVNTNMELWKKRELLVTFNRSSLKQEVESFVLKV